MLVIFKSEYPDEYERLMKQQEEMLQKKLDKAIDRALKMFDKWNDVANCFQKDTGYYFEIQGCIEDAVKIGMQSMTKYEELESEKE